MISIYYLYDLPPGRRPYGPEAVDSVRNLIFYMGIKVKKVKIPI
jgi:hypothetical protein